MYVLALALEVSDYGMTAFLFGDYELANKCTEIFLQLQPAAEKVHNHSPLYATDFNLAAILALKENNLSDLNRYLEKRAQDPADSEFSFLFQDQELLSELTRYNLQDIALEYIQKRTRDLSPITPGTLDLIKYVKDGGIPFSEEWYLEMERLSKQRDGEK